MADSDAFEQALLQGYQCQGASITLGNAQLNEHVFPVPITIPLATLNRHGLIAGATGTGKTKSIQLLAENLSANGVPVLLMDLKGDLSGLAAAGESNEHISARHEKLNIPFDPRAFPVELLSLSDEKGVKLRATVSEFGPVLFSQILELNDTQSGVVAVLFKYCDDHEMALLDLKDFKKILHYALNEGKKEITDTYGRISSSSASAILRKIIELEQQGADKFFGEPSFEVEDLTRYDENGFGYISILRLTDIQNRPKIFSTFMLCLLAEVYQKFPEEGDLEAPKLIIFIDEAHLLFKKATKSLLEQIESIVKLIRSKGVGIFFCTQSPDDIPSSVLSQLGMKVQHALRAFTAKDRKAIKLAAQNYPVSDFYKTDELITSLGIGEAAVTALDEKGRPTPLAATMLCAPRSRMGPLAVAEIDQLVSSSKIIQRYDQLIDRESAYELLTDKIKHAEHVVSEEEKTVPKARSKSSKSTIEKLSKNTMVRQVGRTLMRELMRGLLGILKK